MIILLDWGRNFLEFVHQNLAVCHPGFKPAIGIQLDGDETYDILTWEVCIIFLIPNKISLFSIQIHGFQGELYA